MSDEDDYPCPKCEAPMLAVERDLFRCTQCSTQVDLRELATGYKTPPYHPPKELPMPELVPPAPAPSKLSQALAIARKVAPGALAVLMALEGALTPGTVVHGLVAAVVSAGKALLGLFG